MIPFDQISRLGGYQPKYVKTTIVVQGNNGQWYQQWRNINEIAMPFMVTRKLAESPPIPDLRLIEFSQLKGKYRRMFRG